MKYKYRLERVPLNGVKAATERLTSLGGQGWKVISTHHYGNDLISLLELAFEPSAEDVKPAKPRGRPKKVEATTTTGQEAEVEE